jgi:bifunctional non-homologous end joining protein LigD
VAKSSKKTGLSIPAGARAGAMPSLVNPMLATLVGKPFSDKNWLFETKWDGYRAVCFLSKGKHRLVSRNQLDMTQKFSELDSLGKQIDAETAVLDGEIVAIGKDGLPSFQLMQGRLSRKAQGREVRLVYYLFDLIYYNGFNLKKCTLIDRKELLAKIVKTGPFLAYSDHVIGEGEALYQLAARANLEGIVAKQKDSEYIENRTKLWLKIKAVKSVEVVLCGYTDPQKSRTHFGSLVTGLYKDGELLYSGNVGTGFSRDRLANVYETMKPLETNASPFKAKIPVKNVHWLKPKLVAEVNYTEFTDDGQMRHPSFKGLRMDKSPEECTIDQLS